MNKIVPVRFNRNFYCVILLHKKQQLVAGNVFEVVLTIQAVNAMWLILAKISFYFFMADSTIYPATTLRENIPLNDADAELTENRIKDEKKVFNWSAWSILIVMVGVAVVNNAAVDGSVAIVLAFGYFPLLLMMRFFLNKGIDTYKQDISNGKSILTGTLVKKYSYRSGRCFFFSRPDSNKKIRINVNHTDFNQYPKGARLCVSFLPFSELALHITEAEQA